MVISGQTCVLGDLLQDVTHLLPGLGVAIVDLHRVLPPVIVHVLSVGKDLVANLEKVLGFPAMAVTNNKVVSEDKL